MKLVPGLNGLGNALDILYSSGIYKSSLNKSTSSHSPSSSMPSAPDNVSDILWLKVPAIWISLLRAYENGLPENEYIAVNEAILFTYS